jgi:hypothetical protein
LAEAIRQGCIERPKKVWGHFRIGNDAACALGAAAVGVGSKQKHTMKSMLGLFPMLRVKVKHPWNRRYLALGHLISDLSDFTNYSREEIADWLCKRGGCKHPLCRQEPLGVPVEYSRPVRASK